MAKAVINFSQEHWRTIATLAGGDPNEIMWDSSSNELEVPDVSQLNLDTVLTNFDVYTPVPLSWPTNPDLSSVSLVSTKYWKVDAMNNVVEMTGTEKTSTDTTILDNYKNDLINQIDVETENRIHDGAGFEWPSASGQFFSLSANAQTKWLGLMVSKDFLTYPMVVPTTDDNIFHSVQDAIEAQNMYLTASDTIKTLIADGTTAKQNVRAATTIADAQAAADAYLNP